MLELPSWNRDLLNGSYGHAVIAYAMKENDLDLDKISVLIYDNNYPYNIIKFVGKDGKVMGYGLYLIMQHFAYNGLRYCDFSTKQ